MRIHWRLRSVIALACKALVVALVPVMWLIQSDGLFGLDQSFQAGAYNHVVLISGCVSDEVPQTLVLSLVSVASEQSI